MKKYLSLLLSKFYSKEENELVGKQALPSTKSITISGAGNYSAPADGYLMVLSRGPVDTDRFVYIGNRTIGSEIQTNTQGSRQIGLFQPVAKGETIYLAGAGETMIFKFFYSVGGGRYFLNFLRGVVYA